MAAFNKISNFVVAWLQAQINMSTTGHVFSIALTNTLPTSTMKTSTEITEISTGNGYSHLGSTCQITSYALVSSSLPLVVLGPAAGVVFTASGGSIGPFRYPVLLDQSTAYGGSPQLASWYDYGSAITLNTGETFTVTFDPSSGILQIS